MARYVDGVVLVVPTDKAEEYKKTARMSAEAWMRHGALSVYECWADDMAQQDWGGEKTRAFPEMAGAKEGEEVWFSFIVFKSKAHRDEVNAKVMEEMMKQVESQEGQPAPFDMKRMAYGGFVAEVEGRP